MEALPTSLDGVYRIVFARVRDERGSFVRTYDAAAFAALGLNTAWAEHGEAVNVRAGTVRGLHFQRNPHAELKLIRCTRGAAFDVLLDARSGSPTFSRWQAFELRDGDDVALYVPAGVAHGYQTVRENTVLEYLHSTPYAPEAATGYRYDSPALAIPWPLPVTAISDRDRSLPAF
ncbi:MAG TPA: dTDP-4-dehydrorhamnose 3,5-epimerase family protein [Candidatus Elarobacter sp.]|nr:dTDP-4-dehydrorhamnose 3,5-epimerase family protein [Candidatus Elarobacter sp.]